MRRRVIAASFGRGGFARVAGDNARSVRDVASKTRLHRRRIRRTHSQKRCCSHKFPAGFSDLDSMGWNPVSSLTEMNWTSSCVTRSQKSGRFTQGVVLQKY